MDRRAFIVGGVAALAAPLAAEAQPAAKVGRIGYLGTNRAASPHLAEAFRQGLRSTTPSGRPTPEQVVVS